jgi:hypothetical protein
MLILAPSVDAPPSPGADFGDHVQIAAFQTLPMLSSHGFESIAVVFFLSRDSSGLSVSIVELLAASFSSAGHFFVICSICPVSGVIVPLAWWGASLA